MKPKTMLDLKIGGHVGVHEIEAIARAMFDGETVMAGPEGYVVTVARFEDLSDSTRSFIRKAVLAFTVENILDVESVVTTKDDVSAFASMDGKDWN